MRLAALAACLLMPALGHAAGPIRIVAAENFYGDVAQQIGGSAVKVSSILSNPDQDPHLFEASPSVARAVSDAEIIVYSGIDYDPWMEKLISGARNRDRKTIAVAALVGKKSGDNPHVWYEPRTMIAFARSLTDNLAAIDPAHQADYRTRLTRFEASLEPVLAKLAHLRDRLAGAPVTATEPVFGYMLDALGMDVRNHSFQLSVMNNTEPSATDVAAFEKDLTSHQVRLLIYNSQASDPIAKRMEKIAKEAHVAVVGVTETEPAGTPYQAWMLGTLDAIDRALPAK